MMEADSPADCLWFRYPADLPDVDHMQNGKHDPFDVMRGNSPPCADGLS